MKRSILGVMGMGLLLAASMAAAANPPVAAAAPGKAVGGATLSASQILDRNAQARGGAAAWRSVGSLKLSGKLEAGGKDNYELPFVLEMKRPHKSRLEMMFQQKTAVQVFDGKQGYKVRPFLNRDEVEAFSADETRIALAADELDGPLLDAAAQGTKVALVGMEDVEGKPDYHLTLTRKDGSVRNVWVDAQTFLETRIDGQPRKLNGAEHPVQVWYREYHTEHGLTTARVIETVVGQVKGGAAHKMTIEKVDVNPVLADTRFAKPTLMVGQVGGH